MKKTKAGKAAFVCLALGVLCLYGQVHSNEVDIEFERAFQGGRDTVELIGIDRFLDKKASLSFWIKLNNTTPHAASVSGIHHISGASGKSHYPWTDGKAYFNTFRDDRVDRIELSANVDREKWHLVTITSEPGENGWNLYQNTERVHQAPGSPRVSVSNSSLLGWSDAEGGRVLDGHMRDTRLYDRILSESEIAELLSGSSISDGLVAHWPLDGNSQESVRDLAGNLHGTLIGPLHREFNELNRQIADRSNWDTDRLAREVHHREALILESDRTPVDIVWRRTQALLEHLGGMKNPPDLTAPSEKLEALRGRVEAVQQEADPEQSDLRTLFEDIAAVRREIAFSNPLLDFDKILFIKRHRALYDHMCDQYYGIASRPGGGVYVLENAFGDNPNVRDLLDESVVEHGRLEGRTLSGGNVSGNLNYDGQGRLRGSDDFGGGAFLSPDICFDGEKILFSYVEHEGDTRHRVHWGQDVDYWSEHWDKKRSFHVFKVNADGTGLKQLTDGPWNDIHACWLPDGRIAFVSERRGGFLRCGRVCPVYTLFRMDSQGESIRPLSYHETHEWLPSVNNDGKIVYTRWDYVDRDSDVAHHIWLTYPDGRNPRAPHGNYPDVRESRPWMEMSIRAIPDSHRYLAVAAPHHGQNFGSLVLIDLRVEDDRAMSQVRRVTPEVMLPESEKAPGVPFSRGRGGRGQVYGTPWPLSENFYLTVYDPKESHYGIYLADAFGNRELVYKDPAIGLSDPIPLRARPKPPVIPDQTLYAKESEKEEKTPITGTVSVADVYESMRPLPRDTQLKELRLVQIFPKTTPAPDDPHIGIADRLDQSLTRGVIGVIPIEEDGSAHFEMPAKVPFYMQALDKDGLAVQTMRSATYVHPGERLSCVGCHEPGHKAPGAPGEMPLAFRRPPSQPQAEAEGAYPLTFPRLVQPVLDNNCLQCHEQNRDNGAPGLRGDVFVRHGHSEAFRSLAPFAWGKFGGNYDGIRRNKTTYSIPGDVGALASDLFEMLESGHHGVELTQEEMRRITLWLDANSVFYGDYFNPEAQARGERIMPRLE